MNKLNELRQQAARLRAQLRTILGNSETRDLTDDETTQADDVKAQIASIDKRVKALEDAMALDQAEDDGGRSAGRRGAEIRGAEDLPHNSAANTRNGRHAYSILKALRQMDPSAKGEQLDGIELETHQEIAKRRGTGGHEIRGVLIPWDLTVDTRMSRSFARRSGLSRRAEARDLTTTTGTGAVMNNTLPQMIELLRNTSLLTALGARVMNDMQGNFSIPKQTGAASAYWIAPESATLTRSNQAIGSVPFAPKTLGAQTVYSRAFLHQTSVDAENFVREDFALIMGLELDRAGFNGSGSGAEPTGIINNGSVGVVAAGTNGGAPTWALICALEKAVELANALNGALAYVTSPKGRYKLKTTVKDSNTAAKYLWNEDEDTINGYEAHSSNQIPAALSKGTSSGTLTAAIFGDFTQAVFAFWSGLDVIVNPYSSSANGAVEITNLQDADFRLRQPAAFGVMKDMDPS